MFSYDNRNDAINSLANFYNIAPQTIFDSQDKLQKIIEGSKSNSNDMNTLFAISSILNIKEIPDLPSYQVCYYHRTSFIKNSHWFDQGLLNCQEGIKAFLNKLNDISPNLLPNDYKSMLEAAQIERHNGDLIISHHNKTSNSGPFGFYRLSDAKSPQRQNLNLPEIFMDLNNGTYEYHDQAKHQEIKNFIGEILQPVIVKFWATKSNDYIDSLVLKYWKFLFLELDNYGSGDSCEPSHGVNIPTKQILELITDF